MSTVSQKNWQDQQDLDLLSQLAISAALEFNWSEAAKINQKILSIAGDNIEALNRLARAQSCDGDVDKALKTYKKVLDIDPYNIIAKKNFEKLAKLPASAQIKMGGNGNTHAGSEMFDLASVFLCEPGKTKAVNLLNLAPPAVLASLNCGQKVEIVTKKHSIVISDGNGSYLGALPDDISHRLISFIDGGNKYDAFIKYATTKSLTVFIKETERSAKYASQPSFQESKSQESEN